MAEAAPFRGAFDQPRHVGERELVVAPAHHAEVRFERRERIIGDLRLRCAQRGDQRRLSRVGEADQRRVGEQLELEAQPLLLAVLTLLGEARRAPRVREEPRVAAPTLSAARREPAVAVAHEVGQHVVVGAVDDRALGHVDDEVGAAHTVLRLPRPVRPRPGLAVRVVAKREERRDVAVRLQPHVAAPAAVAAVGPAARHVRLSPEGDAARAAVATLDVALRYVDEARHRELPRYFLAVWMRLRPPALQHPCVGAVISRASGSAPGWSSWRPSAPGSWRPSAAGSSLPLSRPASSRGSP